MYTIEFRIKPCSMYSIRVPYSYQCSRTYPLPAASTLKGLCAHALWHWRAQPANVKEILAEMNTAINLATSRCDAPVTVTACTVSQLTGGTGKSTNALLRQFAHTTAIDCLIAVEEAKLGEELAEALRSAPLYLGDSESLAALTDITGKLTSAILVGAGEGVQKINTVTPFAVAKPGSLSCDPEDSKPVVLYMQDDPVSPTAELKRCLSPLKAQGDDYYPLAGYTFAASQELEIVSGNRLRGVVSRVEVSRAAEGTAKRGKARKKS